MADGIPSLASLPSEDWIPNFQEVKTVMFLVPPHSLHELLNVIHMSYPNKNGLADLSMRLRLSACVLRAALVTLLHHPLEAHPHGFQAMFRPLRPSFVGCQKFILLSGPS